MPLSRTAPWRLIAVIALHRVGRLLVFLKVLSFFDRLLILMLLVVVSLCLISHMTISFSILLLFFLSVIWKQLLVKSYNFWRPLKLAEWQFHMIKSNHGAWSAFFICQDRNLSIPWREVSQDGSPSVGLSSDFNRLTSCRMLFHKRVFFQACFKSCLVDQDFAVCCIIDQVLARQCVTWVNEFAMLCSFNEACIRLRAVVDLNR